MSRSTMRYTRPLVQLFKPGPKSSPEIISVAIHCGCSDGKIREVEWDWKLVRKVLGYIQHHQGGTLILSEGVEAFMVLPDSSKPVMLSGKVVGFKLPEPPAGMKWLERSDRRGEFECVPISEEKVG